MDENMLIGKKIREIEVNGFEIRLVTEDGIVLDYNASDGGYSSWEIYDENLMEEK